MTRQILTEEELGKLHDGPADDNPDSEALRQRVLDALHIVNIKVFNINFISWLTRAGLKDRRLEASLFVYKLCRRRNYIQVRTPYLESPPLRLKLTDQVHS